MVGAATNDRAARRVVAAARLDQVREADDRRERRAQVMADAGQEILAHAAGFVSPNQRRLQRPRARLDGLVQPQVFAFACLRQFLLDRQLLLAMLARAPMHQHCQHQRHRQQVPSHLGPTFPPAGQQPVDEGQPQKEQCAIHRERQQEDPRIGMPAPPAIGHGDRPDHPPQKDQSDHGLRAGAILAQRRPGRAHQAQDDQHAIHPAPEPHPMQVREQHHGEGEHRGRQRPQHTGRAQHRFTAARQHIAVQQPLERQAVENFDDDGGGQKQEYPVTLGHAQHSGVDRHHQQRADQQRQDHRAALRRVHECRRRPQGGFHADGRAALHPHQHRHALTRSQQQRGHRHGRRHFARGERLAVARQHNFEGFSLTVVIKVEAHVFQPGHAE
ncbi:hypothetical protein D3C72_1090340 [compost metagenome]